MRSNNSVHSYNAIIIFPAFVVANNTSTCNLRITHSIHGITAVHGNFQRHKNETTTIELFENLRWMNVIYKIRWSTILCRRYWISRIVIERRREKNVLIKVPFGGFYYFFNQNSILQSVLYVVATMCWCTLQDSSYWNKIFLTKSWNGWLRPANRWVEKIFFLSLMSRHIACISIS